MEITDPRSRRSLNYNRLFCCEYSIGFQVSPGGANGLVAFISLPQAGSWSEHAKDGWAIRVHRDCSRDAQHPCQSVALLVAFSSLRVAVLEDQHSEQWQAYRLSEWGSSTDDFCFCPSTCNSLQSVIAHLYALLHITIIYLSRMLSPDESPIIWPKIAVGAASSLGKNLLRYSLEDWSTLLSSMTLYEFVNVCNHRSWIVSVYLSISVMSSLEQQYCDIKKMQRRMAPAGFL